MGKSIQTHTQYGMYDLVDLNSATTTKTMTTNMYTFLDDDFHYHLYCASGSLILCIFFFDALTLFFVDFLGFLFSLLVNISVQSVYAYFNRFFGKAQC